jgi:hypothetical protein
MTDTWGDIPYSEAGRLKSDNVYYPKYDGQKEIYVGLIRELDEAVKMIDEDDIAFTGGDMIFYGDASKWKKFANSLKCRLAIHTSKVDPDWKQYIAGALASGVMESNEDAAAYHYSVVAPEYCVFYSDTYIEGRNDFTMTRTFTDILKGQRDTLNNKQHPYEGVTDPRLYMFTTPDRSNGEMYIGMPYGISSGNTSRFWNGLGGNPAPPSWYASQPMHLKADFSAPLMTYAEVQFIISEYKGYSEAEFEAGVKASLEYWSGASGIDAEGTEEYLEAVKTAGVNGETLAFQKYIDLYINGTEAWTELRRTGYPVQILQPGEISAGAAEARDGADLRFIPLSEVKDRLISRVKYPTNESTLNGEKWKEAVSRLEDGTNNYYSRMFWDVRTTAYDHPANQ